MSTQKNISTDLALRDKKLLDGIGLITLLSTFCTFIGFIYTLFKYSVVEQFIAFMIFIGFGIGFVLNRLKLVRTTKLYMTIYPPTAFMLLILLIGGFFGQALGLATMAFLAFIAYRKNPKLRIIIISYDILAFIIPTIYISIYGPILTNIDLPFDEILVFIASLAWLSLTFRMYDENKTRNYTNALEENNEALRINELALNKAQSDLKEQNKKLSILNQELYKKNKQIEEFTFIVTHDLKSPLNNINVIAKELQEQPELTTMGSFNDYFKHLETSSTRMTNLVHGLLEYAEIGDSNQMETVDCNEVIKQVQHDLSERIKETNAKINFSKMPKIIGRERDIRMLFQNLIHNALKFTSKKDIPLITISLENIPEFYLFSMKDNGIGIPKNQKEKIFNAFHKLNNQSEFEGSGIGLYGCKRVIDIHKGKIWVESEVDKGSTFYFTISSKLTVQQENQNI